MQDTFARARTWPKGCTKAARPSARATIGYLVYKVRGGIFRYEGWFCS